jgi:hypothetical protein
MNHLPQAWKIKLGSFLIFSKICRDIRKSRCTTGINDTGGNFATSFAGVVDTGGKFATSVNYTGSKFANGVNNPGDFATGINNTGSKFATGARHQWQTMGTISGS